MLLDPVYGEAPWPHITFSSAFSNAHLRHLEGLFSTAREWDQHQSELYDGQMCDASESVDAEFATQLIDRMAVLTRLQLTSKLKVNLQRMAEGEDVRPHSDQPLLGFEIARLVLQLNADWQTSEGGMLCLHSDPDGRDVARCLPPEKNHAFAFVMSPNSYHSVTRVYRERRSVVFYVWHVGNTEALANEIVAQTRGLHFGDLPQTLDACRARAEGTLPEDLSFAAAMAASLLMRWGYEPQTQQRAYESIAWPDRDPSYRWWEDGFSTSVDEDTFAVLLVQWVVVLHQQCFVPERWERLHRILATSVCPPRLQTIFALAFLGA